MGTGVRLPGDNNKTLIHRNNSGRKPPRSIVALRTPAWGDGARCQINDIAREMEIWDRHSKTFCHETQAHRGNFPDSVYPLYAFQLFLLFILLIQFKK